MGMNMSRRQSKDARLIIVSCSEVVADVIVDCIPHKHSIIPVRELGQHICANAAGRDVHGQRGCLEAPVLDREESDLLGLCQ
jgi:hypothetical protein